MSIMSFSKSFVENILPVNCGIPDSVLKGISMNYVVIITASLGTSLIEQFNRSVGGIKTGPGGGREFAIFGYIQDKITLNASSTWEGITQGLPGDIDADLKAGIKLGAGLLGRTEISTLSTRRKWAGSSPISLSLKLKFEAFKDAYKEVMLPCIALQSLMLPRGGLFNTVGLIPPGPSPFDFSLKGEQESERGENIRIAFGTYLTFKSVIIKDVKVTMDNRMSATGPIGADVDMTIETYQMLTREDLFKILGDTVEVPKDQMLG